MRKAALLALLLALGSQQAQALETDELLGLVAMPLAVAAVSDVTGVPAEDLSHFVATLNRAQVPPTQVVQVVRYAPAAFVIEDEQPTFIEYVDTQVDQGVTGSRLVTVIEERYETYDLEPDFSVFNEPATTYVVREDYVPEVVVTRVADSSDLLALVAMPLAVAALADVSGIPVNDLTSVVASLNAARVSPVQVVEVLRYAPVVMVNEVERPRFVQFVDTQVREGVTGPRLVRVIDDRFRANDTERRIASVREHPHGGPPGQLKKQLAVRTGAEVVHRSTRRVVVDRDDDERVVRPKKQRRAERAVATRAAGSDRDFERAERPRGERRVKVERKRGHEPRAERGRGHGRGNGDGHGKGKGKGKG
jgi:hypothetical protein